MCFCMKVTSPVFDDGGQIPEKYSYIRENVNPPLTFSDVPEEASSLALIMDDPDAVEPAGKIWLHWTVWNIPADTEKIEEDESPGVEGTTDFRDTGYGGPNPPDGEHKYVFRVYALDSNLDLEEGASREELEEAMEGHVIEETKLEGDFAPLDS